VIGWAISKRIDAELGLAALKIALDHDNRRLDVFITPIAVCSTPVSSTVPCSK
jgi:hypothetical protein